MPWYIDEAECCRALRFAARMAVGEACIDGQAPRFFLGKCVGVGACELLHKRRLAMVNMACGGDNKELAW